MKNHGNRGSMIWLAALAGLAMVAIGAAPPDGTGPGVPLTAAKPGLPGATTRPGSSAPVYANSLGMKFVSITPGQFSMGSPEPEKERDDNVEQAHPVTLTKAYLIGVYHVTRGQFAAFVKDTDYKTEAEKGVAGISIQSSGVGVDWRKPGIEQGDDHPVVMVSWNDANAFAKWLSLKEKRTYRLPTEAEWEYACRAGTTGPYNFGNTIFMEQANCDGNYRYRGGKTGIYRAKTTPVGTFAPNAWGLYDMHGNAWEWCSDWLAPFKEKQEATDPTGPDKGLARVIKGGSWYDEPRFARSANRGGLAPANRSFDIGFRLVLEPLPQ